MVRAKKKFGQNFLKDESVLAKIIESMPKDNKTIVEIGPGLGDLTKKLLEVSDKVVAFEVDLELCGILQEKFKTQIAEKKLELVCTDILDEWGKSSLIGNDYHLVANLPYYIATKIILKALSDKSCKTVLAMTQKEVANKFAALVGEKDFSALAILASSISKAEVLFDVGSNSFDPPPKVTSSVLRLVKFDEYLKEGDKGLFTTQNEFEKYKLFLRTAYKSPRKLLLKNLSSIYEKDKIIRYFEDSQIPHNLRPHQLSTSHYHLLFKIIGAENAREQRREK